MNTKALISNARIRQIVSLIDLTNLNDECDDKAIEALCTAAFTPAGPVAAVCVWPAFVASARTLLGDDSLVKIATVVNFPSGEQTLEHCSAAIEKALSDGADEIDYVLPYTTLINGNFKQVSAAVQCARDHVSVNQTLKVILETGELGSRERILAAADIAISNGADFIKTSTGKVPVNATPEAAMVMLEAIAGSCKDVGFKAAGGIKTVNEAQAYLQLAEERLGAHWVDSAHFRFGASSLLQHALVEMKVLSPSTDNRESY